jgi:anti-anti-sigma factor
MQIAIRQKGIHTIIDVNGEINYFNIDNFKKTLLHIAEGDSKSVVVNMENIDAIDSSGIGVIISTYKKMQKRDGSFGLLNVNQNIMALLTLSTIDKFLEIYSSEMELV